MPISDAELALKAQQNSMGAFRELMERYKKKIYFTALGVVKTHQDAEDILQETMLQALRSIARLKQPAGFGSWVLRIAYNRSIDLVRKRKREILPGEDEAGNSMFDFIESTDGKSDPHRGMENQQITKAILSVLKDMPESQREAFKLKHVSQLSIKEISEITESSESTVKTNIFRAVQKLRAELANFNERQAGSEITGKMNAYVP